MKSLFAMNLMFFFNKGQLTNVRALDIFFHTCPPKYGEGRGGDKSKSCIHSFQIIIFSDIITTLPCQNYQGFLYYLIFTPHSDMVIYHVRLLGPVKGLLAQLIELISIYHEP